MCATLLHDMHLSHTFHVVYISTERERKTSESGSFLRGTTSEASSSQLYSTAHRCTSPEKLKLIPRYVRKQARNNQTIFQNLHSLLVA